MQFYKDSYQFQEFRFNKESQYEYLKMSINSWNKKVTIYQGKTLQSQNYLKHF